MQIEGYRFSVEQNPYQWKSWRQSIRTATAITILDFVRLILHRKETRWMSTNGHPDERLSGHEQIQPERDSTFSRPETSGTARE
jgi:hypothetical protein